MNFFLSNILLALIWSAATGEIHLASLVTGYVLGYVILWFTQPFVGRSAYFRRFPKAISFVVYYVWQLVKSNVRVAHDVLTPRSYMRPGVVAIPLDASTDTEITLLANAITMTPGSLSLDVSDDRKVLYIHAMFVDDVEGLRDEIKNGFERRLLEILR